MAAKIGCHGRFPMPTKPAGHWPASLFSSLVGLLTRASLLSAFSPLWGNGWLPPCTTYSALQQRACTGISPDFPCSAFFGHKICFLIHLSLPCWQGLFPLSGISYYALCTQSIQAMACNSNPIDSYRNSVSPLCAHIIPQIFLKMLFQTCSFLNFSISFQ